MFTRYIDSPDTWAPDAPDRYRHRVTKVPESGYTTDDPLHTRLIKAITDAQIRVSAGDTNTVEATGLARFGYTCAVKPRTADYEKADNHPT